VVRSKLFNGFVSVPRLGDQFHICLVSKQRREAASKQWMVIYGEYSNLPLALKYGASVS